MSARDRDRRGWLLGAVALLGLAAVALWWSQNFELKQVRVPVPPRGEAAFNPLYALKRTLQLDGIAVQSRRRLALGSHPLSPADTVLLLGDLRAVPRQDVTGLLAWMQRGGHLVVAVPSAGARGGDQHGALLQAIGVEVEDGEWDCATFRVIAPATKTGVEDTSICGRMRLRLEQGVRPLLRWRDAQGNDLLVRLRSGAGSIDLVASLQFAINSRLENPASATLARQLLAPNYGQGTVHLVYNAEMLPLWRLLLERAWMAWLPLLLALSGWLWWRTQRRGPLLPSPPPTRRSLLEHVQASGEHMHRYGRGHLLHTSLRQAFDARLRQRDPYAASLTGEAQRQAIAARTGLPEAEVEAALRSPVPFVAADLRLRIAKLNRLRHRL